MLKSSNSESNEMEESVGDGENTDDEAGVACVDTRGFRRLCGGCGEAMAEAVGEPDPLEAMEEI